MDILIRIVAEGHRITTKGWSFLVECSDGSSDCVPLKDLKESYPVQVAECAIANRIKDEPTLA
eukprot:14502537-Ditylum_brightwellii.AAC.1